MIISGLSIVILGIILSIIYYEITDNSPGGIIVPGLLVAYINQIDRLIFTLVVSLFAYLLLKLLSKKLLIFGKRRFVLLILLSLVVSFILTTIFGLFNLSIASIATIGYIIPGIISNEYYKQGVVKTLVGLTIVTGLLEIIILLAH